MGEKDISILVCDDSMLIRKVFTETLLSLGYNNISQATNGQEAVDLCKDKSFDIVFMDLVMPVLGGIEAIKEIKIIDEAANIVVVSSVGTKNKLKEALEAGANNFIQKPFEEEHIKKVLEEYIN